MLLEARPSALSKPQLHDLIWPDVHVSDASLSRLVSELRSALGEPGREGRLVRTIHRHGTPSRPTSRGREPLTGLPGGAGGQSESPSCPSAIGLGERARPLEWTRRALRLAADDPGSLWNIGTAFAMAGETNDASSCLEPAIRHCRDLPWADHDSFLESVRGEPRSVSIPASDVGAED